MLSIIIPVHNEAKILRANILRLQKELKYLGRPYEIIIAEDGSDDGSREIAQELQSKTIRAISFQQRMGRGLTLTKTIPQAQGQIVIYMDADLATDICHVEVLACAIEDRADIAIGSRLAPGSTVSGRSIERDFFSKGYNWMLRRMFKTSVQDHQCGFKAFSRETIVPLLEQIEDSHWFWDSELLIRAQEKGLKVVEIPVGWRDRPGSSVRLQHDVIQMAVASIRLRLKLRGVV